MAIRFGDCDFDPLAGELRRGEVCIRLEPQPARVLAVLLERAGQVVTREELQRRVWTDETFVDFDRGLNYCVAQIRSALGDSASEPRFVETLPRRGYRFIGAVDRVASSRSAPKQMKTRVAVAAALSILALSSSVAWFVFPRDQRVSIAVVPFNNETGVADHDRLAQALTDATVAALTKSSDRLAVIGNAAILAKPRAFRDLLEIGNSLGVSHVILGQVQQLEGQLRVTAHLIRVDDQAHVWAEVFEPARGDASTLDDAVPAAVVAAVASRILTHS